VSKSRLNVVLTVKADEALLLHLKEMLAATNKSGLHKEVAEMVRQKLIEAGSGKELEVRLGLGQIRGRVETSGGLSATEWLATGEVASTEIGSHTDSKIESEQ